MAGYWARTNAFYSSAGRRISVGTSMVGPRSITSLNVLVCPSSEGARYEYVGSCSRMTYVWGLTRFTRGAEREQWT